MTTFLALYRGQTVAEAQLVAVTADPTLVADFSTRLLTAQAEKATDPVIEKLEEGRRSALRLIRREATSAR